MYPKTKKFIVVNFCDAESAKAALRLARQNFPCQIPCREDLSKATETAVHFQADSTTAPRKLVEAFLLDCIGAIPV